jgi:hypothetical protein
MSSKGIINLLGKGVFLCFVGDDEAKGGTFSFVGV